MITDKTHIEVPADGAKIVPGEPTPDNPIIPFIEGDGIGVDITPVMKDVVDAAVEKAYGGTRQIHWMEIYAGEKSTRRSSARTRADGASTGWRSTQARSPRSCTDRTSGFPRRRSRRCGSTRSRSRGR